MPVSGIVMHIDAGRKKKLVSELASLSGVELQPVPDDAVLVAVLDTPDFASEKALCDQLSALPGVRSVALAYHNFEDVVDG